MSRLCFFLDKVKIGTKFTRKEGYLCTKCSCLDYRRIHDSVEDEDILVGDVPDNLRVFLRCLIKSSDLDSDTMDAHEEKVRLHERYLNDEEQRDQMIVRAYNLNVTGAAGDEEEVEECDSDDDEEEGSDDDGDEEGDGYDDDEEGDGYDDDEEEGGDGDDDEEGDGYDDDEEEGDDEEEEEGDDDFDDSSASDDEDDKSWDDDEQDQIILEAIISIKWTIE